MREKMAMPELRRARLRRLLNVVPIVKTIEVHSGLTGLIAEKTIVANGLVAFSKAIESGKNSSYVSEEVSVGISKTIEDCTNDRINYL